MFLWTHLGLTTGITERSFGSVSFSYVQSLIFFKVSPILAKSVFRAYALTPSEKSTYLREKADCKQSSTPTLFKSTLFPDSHIQTSAWVF